jgi:hypothetical protein
VAGWNDCRKSMLFSRATKRRTQPMPDDHPRKPRLTDNFAGFDTDPRRSGRRKSRWSLRPVHEPSEGEAVDAVRFVKAPELYAGLGRKPVKE